MFSFTRLSRWRWNLRSSSQPSATIRKIGAQTLRKSWKNTGGSDSTGFQVRPQSLSASGGGQRLDFLGFAELVEICPFAGPTDSTEQDRPVVRPLESSVKVSGDGDERAVA